MDAPILQEIQGITAETDVKKRLSGSEAGSISPDIGAGFLKESFLTLPD